MHRYCFAVFLLILGSLFGGCEDEKNTQPPDSFEVQTYSVSKLEKTNNTNSICSLYFLTLWNESADEGSNASEETLQRATSANADYLQLATWNDFREGTMIETTWEFGFDYLMKIKEFTGVSGTETKFDLFPFSKEKRVSGKFKNSENAGSVVLLSGF